VLGFNAIKQWFLGLFSRYDRYLIVELLNHYVQVTVLKVSAEKKEIRVVKNFLQPLPEFTPLNSLRAVRLLLKKVRRLDSYKIILSLDSSLATTMYASVPLIRQHPKEAIDEADLDNLISQAIWKFFDRYRLKVANKMNVDDIDVLLSDVRIRSVRLDGHKIVNPIGFKAKSVEIYFSQTFIIRELMKMLQETMPKENIALITESGTAISHILWRALGKDRFFVANLFPDQTSLFSASNGRMSHHDNFSWGEQSLTRSLFNHLKVDQATAKSLVDAYATENGSQNFLRRFENILIKELQIFANGLNSLIEEPSEIYVNSFFNMPSLIFSDRFNSRLHKSSKLLPLSTNLITEKFGYSVQFKKSTQVKNIFSVLCAFLEINFLPQNDKMSHLANRRVRWLIT